MLTLWERLEQQQHLIFCDQLTNWDNHMWALLSSLHTKLNCNIKIWWRFEKTLNTKEHFGCKPSGSSLKHKFPEIFFKSETFLDFSLKISFFSLFLEVGKLSIKKEISLKMEALYPSLVCWCLILVLFYMQRTGRQRYKLVVDAILTDYLQINYIHKYI